MRTALVTLFFTISSIAYADEVIEIHERLPPAVKPAPEHFSAKRLPPYSDEAILSDAWTRAWVLLDVDDHGTVTRFKFLKRPGFDLEAIAASEVWRLHFKPGRNARDQPVAAYVIWRIEWPSNGWMQTMEQTGVPDDVGVPPYVHSPFDSVPCRGSGPLHLGSLHPVYRDCSRPDLRNGSKEHWITRTKDTSPK
jgi:hypothetical protein